MRVMIAHRRFAFEQKRGFHESIAIDWAGDHGVMLGGDSLVTRSAQMMCWWTRLVAAITIFGLDSQRRQHKHLLWIINIRSCRERKKCVFFFGAYFICFMSRKRNAQYHWGLEARWRLEKRHRNCCPECAAILTATPLASHIGGQMKLTKTNDRRRQMSTKTQEIDLEKWIIMIQSEKRRLLER